MRLVALAGAATLAFSADAHASQIGFEGSEIVARADPAEASSGLVIQVDPAAGVVAAVDTTRERDPLFQGIRFTKVPRPGAGCTASPVGPVNQAGVACPLAGAQRIQVDWSAAVPAPIEPSFLLDPSGPKTGVQLNGGSIPVVIQGGPGAEELRAQTDGPVTVSAGDGDDRVNVVAPASTVDAGPGNDRLLVALGTNPTGRAPSRVDAGAGNDSVLAALPDESAVFGGPGNDNLDVGTENTTGKETILRQRVDCGEGADAAHIDARDVLGPGCAPGLREPARDMTAGRFDDTGRIRVTLGRVSPARARIGLTGPRPPAMSATTTTGLRAYAGVKLVPRASGTLSTTITPIASVRRSLRKRRASVRNVYVSLESSAPGAPSGDRATLFVRTVLRRAPGR